MDKLLLVNKEANYTSRDVINILSGIFKQKKIGHFGTLDPLADGLLVVGLGSYTKLCDYHLFDKKEYIVKVLVGTSTTTFDLEGDIVKKSTKRIKKEELLKILNDFTCTYLQEVPIYSSVKVNGRKLYDYARNNEKITLPKKEVTIYKIDFLKLYEENNKQYFDFKVLVSKGTYIRSLINDMSKKINIPLCMAKLTRTKQGSFKIEDASTITDIKNGNYKLYDIEDFLKLTIKDIKTENKKEIINGYKQKIKSKDTELVLYKNNDKNIALYRKEDDEYNKLFFFFKD